MKSLFPAPRRALLLPTLIVVLLLLVASSASAKIRTEGGGNVPFYARIEPGYVVHTDEWAAIVFYYPTDCVPDDFNLLEFYDFNVACEHSPTTDGFIIWSGEPGFSAPIQMKLQGLGSVPVWFVAWPELEAAVADGILTLPELAAIPSLLTGMASLYNETLHPDGGAQVPMINQVAYGLLEDGRSFQVHATFVTVSVMNVRIAIE